MSDLAEFLLARIAEDEEAARAVSDDRGTWALNDDGGELYWLHLLVARSSYPASIDPEDAAHVVRWSPARVLAECEAKRRIVARKPGIRANDDTRNLWWDAVALLALPYADHPDHRPEWRP